MRLRPGREHAGCQGQQGDGPQLRRRHLHQEAYKQGIGNVAECWRQYLKEKWFGQFLLQDKIFQKK